MLYRIKLQQKTFTSLEGKTVRKGYIVLKEEGLSGEILMPVHPKYWQKLVDFWAAGEPYSSVEQVQVPNFEVDMGERAKELANFLNEVGFKSK